MPRQCSHGMLAFYGSHLQRPTGIHFPAARDLIGAFDFSFNGSQPLNEVFTGSGVEVLLPPRGAFVI